ncbi:MAG: hypothetical protein [Circular genetic element sp.]|nr:MAG: hypothetical protein [Circular genetic element sp.]
MTRNGNPIQYVFITIPHTRMSEKHPDADLSRDSFAAFMRKSYQMKTFICVEEPHRKSVGQHIHALVVLEEKSKSPFKKILTKIQNEYPTMSARIDIRTIHYKTLYTNFQYLCEPDYQPKSGSRPKSIAELDPLPIKEGHIPEPPGGFQPFNQRDWTRLSNQLFKQYGVICQPNWELAKTNPYLTEF